MTLANEPPVGGAFLFDSLESPETVFTPEQFSSDALFMAKSVEEFVRGEVLPVNARLEAQEPGLMHRLLQQAGGLGFLGMGVPERFGGLDLPKSQIALLTERAAIAPAFALSAGVHSGVGTLPLLFFGTEEQRAHYLPKLATGEWIGAFALSEEGAGSDALSAKAKAVPTGDGAHYLLNGTKMWITNGGFADLFTTFVRVEGQTEGQPAGQGFSAFLVERGYPGVSTGREEHKLGLKGSSTRRLVLDDVPVPIENLLGEIGKGHRPALYALNLGRLAIAATALGMCKENLRIAARYARQRVQFGVPIANFGLIQHKLAEMAVRTFVLESMLYRTAGYLDKRFGPIDPEAAEAQERYQAASEEYAIECALLKVYGTEALGYVVDEALQIHGGYGFSEEYPVAQAYRDARVFRIFEGTNEINRLAVIDQLLRRERAGRLPLQTERDRLALHREGVGSTQGADPLSALETVSKRLQTMTLQSLDAALVASSGVAMQQEIISLLTDRITEVYASQSLWLRCRQIGPGSNSSSLQMLAAAQIYSYEALLHSDANHRTLRSAVGTTHEIERDTALQDALPHPIPLRQEVAAAVLDQEGYPW